MRAILKRLADVVALLLVFPAYALYRLAAWVFGYNRAFPGWSEMFSLFPGLPGVYLRRAFYRLALAECADGVSVRFGTLFSYKTAMLGRNVYIGPYSVVGDVTLEDDVLVASHVSIIHGSEQHGIGRLDIPVREQPGSVRRVTIGADSWIGERAVVMADVGKHCVIGAGAVVTMPIPDCAIAAGIPARVIRYRDQSSLDRSRAD